MVYCDIAYDMYRYGGMDLDESSQLRIDLVIRVEVDDGLQTEPLKERIVDFARQCRSVQAFLNQPEADWREKHEQTTSPRHSVEIREISNFTMIVCFPLCTDVAADGTIVHWCTGVMAGWLGYGSRVRGFPHVR